MACPSLQRRVWHTEQEDYQDGAGEDVVEIFVEVHRQAKADVAIHVGRHTAPVGEGSNQIHVDGDALLFAIPDEEIRVAVGPLEAEELVHQHYGGGEEAQKANPVAGDDDRIVQVVGYLGRRLVSADAVFPAHLLGRNGAHLRQQSAVCVVLMEVVGHGPAKRVRGREDEHRACQEFLCVRAGVLVLVCGPCCKPGPLLDL